MKNDVWKNSPFGEESIFHPKHNNISNKSLPKITLLDSRQSFLPINETVLITLEIDWSIKYENSSFDIYIKSNTNQVELSTNTFNDVKQGWRLKTYVEAKKEIQAVLIIYVNGVITNNISITFSRAANDDINAAKDKNTVRREIYLTFDDGLESGTEEILELLKELNVRATFFLIGKRIESMYNRDPDKCLSLMKDIFENHCVGNHSYSHANEWYTSYYRNGGVVYDEKNGKELRRSVVDDFHLSKDIILHYFEKANGIPFPKKEFSEKVPLSKNQKNGVLRFPGSNTWFLKNRFINIKKTNRGNHWSLGEKDTKEEAAVLGYFYNIFGWDIEWKMSLPLSSELQANAIKERHNNKTLIYSDINHTDPNFDLYSKEYIHYDRPVQTVKQMKDEILDFAFHSEVPFDSKSKSSGKVVLLMHDRMFRNGKITKNNTVNIEDTTELDKLRELIEYLKKINAKFKTVDEY
jgi:peptidoglycan/xylan/chitin deacetylase (PgdA/CDA1 family)